MTRPKADADGWILDPIARDRIVAKEVVYGIRQMTLLLRGIRDDMVESRALRDRIEELETEVRDVRSEMASLRAGSGGQRVTTQRWTPCSDPQCSLPSGHTDNHRGRRHDLAISRP